MINNFYSDKITIYAKIFLFKIRYKDILYFFFYFIKSIFNSIKAINIPVVSF